MTLGILLACISSLALSVTVITDKLMVGDFYQGDPRKAWFVSSFVGTILGLLATGLAWFLLANQNLIHKFIIFSTEHVGLVLLMMLSGILVSLTLRSYFVCMSLNTISASVAIAITATPVFVFITQILFHGELITFTHIMSVLVTVTGLIGFGLISKHHKKGFFESINLPLIRFIALSTTYVVLLDELFPHIESVLQLPSAQASLVAMPFYWIGFGAGITSIRHATVRLFITRILARKKFVAIILFLETVGVSFYFFEFLGIAEIDVALVSLIIGAHIVFVWTSDLYMRQRYRQALRSGKSEVSILFFRIPVSQMTAYEIKGKTLFFQGLFVLLTLFGLTLWV